MKQIALSEENEKAVTKLLAVYKKIDAKYDISLTKMTNLLVTDKIRQEVAVLKGRLRGTKLLKMLP